jgi:hypothetical protein
MTKKIKDYENLMKDIREIRRMLLAPTSQEELELARQAAVTLMQSKEFGNFVSLSTIYNMVK